MDNHQTPPATPDVQEQLAQFIQHEVHHAVEHIVGGPVVVRKLVGETIRHIGMSLSALSTSYLPLDMAEIMVPPARMADTNDALVLARRPIQGDNTFTVLVTAEKQNDELVMTITLFRAHPDDLAQSTFYVFPGQVQEEILRQLQTLITAPGSQLFQAVMFKDYFQAEAPVPAPVPVAAAVTASAVPTVQIGDDSDDAAPSVADQVNALAAAARYPVTPNPFSVGNTVRLKSGGPIMMVDSIVPDGSLACTWHDGTRMCSGAFHHATLVAVN